MRLSTFALFTSTAVAAALILTTGSSLAGEMSSQTALQSMAATAYQDYQLKAGPQPAIPPAIEAAYQRVVAPTIASIEVHFAESELTIKHFAIEMSGTGWRDAGAMFSRSDRNE